MAKIHSKSICPVCLTEDNEEKIILHKTRRQSHIFCVDCCIHFLEPIIKKTLQKLRKNIYTEDLIKCPGTYHGLLRNKCIKSISFSYLSDEKLLFKKDIYTDILRIKYLYENKNTFKICINSDCDNIIQIFNNECFDIKCDKCNAEWCKFCYQSPFHQGKFCFECDLENNPDGEFIKEKMETKEIKLCPSCFTPTEKEKDENGDYTGCNKMLCVFCDVKWCWLCQDVGIDYSHYNSENETGCGNKLWFGTNIL